MLEGASTIEHRIPEPLPWHLNTNTNAMLEGASTTVQGIPEPLPEHLNANTQAMLQETNGQIHEMIIRCRNTANSFLIMLRSYGVADYSCIKNYSAITN